MLRAFLCSAAVLALCVYTLAAADTKAGKDKGAKDGKHHRATITKVDAKKGTITLKWKNKEGKQVEKTFHLAEDVEYLDSTGRVAQADVFTSGDDVLVLEREGMIKQVKKAHKGAKNPGHKEDHKDKKDNKDNKEGSK